MVIALSDRLSLEKKFPSASFFNIFLFFVKVQNIFLKRKPNILVIFFLFVLHLEKLKIFINRTYHF